MPQGIHVVGVDAHHIAVGVGVKIPDGQGLHVSEQIVADLLLHALGDGDHQAVVGQGAQGAHHIEAGHQEQSVEQAGEHRVFHGQQRRDIVVDQGAQENGAGHRGHRADQDAYQHQKKADQVAPAHITEQAPDRVGLFLRHLIHPRSLPSSGIHKFPGRSHSSGAARRGCPWRKSFRHPSPGFCPRPRWKRYAGQ